MCIFRFKFTVQNEDFFYKLPYAENVNIYNMRTDFFVIVFGK